MYMSDTPKTIKGRNPWAWVPTLYVAEGLPNVIVMTVAVVMYMQMGLSDTDIALYTSWLGLPWVIKPFWSPFIDIVKTKRWWVLAMQVLLGSALAGVAFTLQTDFWFQGTMFCFFLMAFSSATHDIAADGFYMIALTEHQQAWFVGIRNTFYRIAVIFGNGVLVPVAGLLQHRYQIAYSWTLVFYGMAALFIALWLYHCYTLRLQNSDLRTQTSDLRPQTSDERLQTSDLSAQLTETLRSLIHKLPPREMLFALLFLLLYRFPEAMLTKMSATFLMRPSSEGGLGLSPEAFGLANGTVGLIGLLLGGIVGGWLASRDGLKRWLWPMVCAITLPDIVYVYMSYALPSSLTLISCCLFVEQFGYGLGFTALTLYMLYFSQGKYQTSHYAICTGLSYLGLMLPGMVSGWLKDAVGYHTFFLLVMVFCVITFAVTALIKVDPQFGKKA